jgi:hypothetical protein
MNALSAYEQNLNDWRRAHEQCELIRQWAFNTQEQVDMCVEVERELDVPDWLMARVHKRRFWYLHPSAIYPSLEAYIDATRAALVADVRVYQAEVAAAEAAHCKRCREELKAERAAAPAPPSPLRRRAPSRRARPSGRPAAHDVFLLKKGLRRRARVVLCPLYGVI